MLITWVQYVITAKDKKDKEIPTFKSPCYVETRKKTATLITFVAKSWFSEGAAYIRTPRAMVPRPQKFTYTLVK